MSLFPARLETPLKQHVFHSFSLVSPLPAQQVEPESTQFVFV